MPIILDTLFEHPPADAKLWRYMDISKLVSMLTTKTLFFARADRFSDSWEGSISPSDLEAWNVVRKVDEAAEGWKTLIKNAFKGFRRHTYISCWHQNDGESAAMWKLYLKSDDGIALQTSFGRLRKELDKSSRRIRLGRVQYKDYKKEHAGGEPLPLGNDVVVPEFAPFIYKRRGFMRIPDDVNNRSGAM